MRRLMLGALVLAFAGSAVAKIADLSNTTAFFADTLGIGDRTASLVVISSVTLELGLALAIVTLPTSRRVFTIVLCCIGAFSALAVMLWAQGVDNCGCMGTVISTSPPLTLAKNAALFGCAYYIRSRRSGAVGPHRSDVDRQHAC